MMFNYGTNLFDDISGNYNVIRNPTTNEIDQLIFDINNPDIRDNIVNMLSRNIFNSILNPESRNENDRFMIDPSNNILFYETIITPPNRGSGSNAGTSNRTDNNNNI